MTQPKIIVRNICPPIPVRGFDWCAFRDGTEEAGPYGYGATEDAAVRDLIEQERIWRRTINDRERCYWIAAQCGS